MPEQLKEKIRQAFDAGWNRADLDVMYGLCSREFVHHRPPFPTIESLEAEKQDIANTFKAFSNIRFTMHEIVVEGDIVVMRWTWQAQYTGQSPDLPIAANGKNVNMTGCSLLHLVNGKIVEEWEYADYLGYLIQLGVVPPIE